MSTILKPAFWYPVDLFDKYIKTWIPFILGGILWLTFRCNDRFENKSQTDIWLVSDINIKSLIECHHSIRFDLE